LNRKGRDYTPKQDIYLKGLQIRKEHAILLNTRGTVTLHAVDTARILVNDKAVTPASGPRTLEHGDWIVFGYNHVYRFKDPLNSAGASGGAMSYAQIVGAARTAAMRCRMPSFRKVKSKWTWAVKGALRLKDESDVCAALRKGWALVSEANAIVEDMRLGNLFTVSLVVTAGDMPGAATAAAAAAPAAGTRGGLTGDQLDLLGMLGTGAPAAQIRAVYTVDERSEIVGEEQTLYRTGEALGRQQPPASRPGSVSKQRWSSLRSRKVEDMLSQEDEGVKNDRVVAAGGGGEGGGKEGENEEEDIRECENVWR
jgi:hypothetical protein